MDETSIRQCGPVGRRTGRRGVMRALVWGVMVAGGLTACTSGPQAVTAEGLATQAATEDARRRAEAVGLAQSALPQEGAALAYVYQEPGVPLIDEAISLDGGPPVPLRVNQYLVWQVEPGPHILEAWRGSRRLASRAVTLQDGQTLFFKFAVKNNLGGLRYLAPAGSQEGAMFVRQANFGGQ